MGRGNADGSFDIAGVPDGNYSLTWWDEPQDYNLNFINVTMTNGETVHMGNLPLNGWWTEYDGFVFNDTNRNGVKDGGEYGVPGFTLTLRQPREHADGPGPNTAVDRRERPLLFESGYPLGEWMVMEAYNDSFYTTGITYQADNQPNPTTVKGAGVDVSVMPIIGLGGRLDWGVHAYDATGATASTPATVASLARSATTRRATSSTLSTPPSRTGSRESPTSLSSSTPRRLWNHP